MAICGKCKVDFGEASYRFCLECGARLAANDSDITVQMSGQTPLIQVLNEAVTKINEAREEKERIKQSCLEFIQEAVGFRDLEFDSRWERLIERYFDADPDSCIRFLKRIIGRIRLANDDAEMISGVKYDLVRAIQYTEPEAADNYLKETGLL